MIDLISRLCDLINHHRERRTWRGFAWNWSGSFWTGAGPEFSAQSLAFLVPRIWLCHPKENHARRRLIGS